MDSGDYDPGASGSALPEHVPVLLDRCVALLDPALSDAGAVMVDATVGLGGHSEALLRAHPGLRLIGLDRDEEALSAARTRLQGFGDRVTLVHTVYDRLPDVLAELADAGNAGADVGIERVQGVLFDLGVSSLQLDRTARGFAYSHDAPLDMRMDPSTGQTAADVVNTYAAGDLVRILREYGQERFASRIVERIVAERQIEPFSSSARLADLVRHAIPAATRRTGGNPAKRTFQALRIEVNDELGSLERALPAAVAALAVGGRMVVLAYQSLEDRLVKRTFAAGTAVSAPPDLPVVPESAQPRLKLLTRGAQTASTAEVAANPRAASVRLRAVERIREVAA
jgi:16S rRNA (cytosine1402-N4)-methyltransferase